MMPTAATTRIRTLGSAVLLACLLGACSSSEPTDPAAAAQVSARAAFPYDVDHELNQPVVFANGRIRTSNGISFSPDGRTLYVTQNVDSVAHIFETRYENGRWSEPERLPFNSSVPDYQPRLTPDGRRLYFNSRRPIPGTTAETKGSKLWYVDRTATGWSEPVFLDDVNTRDPELRDSYPSIARDGTLYFRSTRPGGLGDGDIYRAEPRDGGYAPAVNVTELNSVHNENDLAVDPDERFVIFNRYIEETDELMLYLSFATADGWTTPRVIEELETSTYELTPTLSPDGRYFFYELRNLILQIDLLALIREEEPIPGGRLGRSS